ncbi:hypothetical protein HYPSUDRAFT_55205 [Hypholoma sublateritium FD-334 SS-4]|uniref:Uncharacterized protein n=1 Tax=Hypholoma sublateritium (strain FD-334 SS-4) TaxID=945553 RepID=A0A0D2L4U1_HYPSF|nr:hypothetical protein HYPSUDRAFT_55205 [Hypholoma sublateritium FD-334 SS-4]
MASALGLSSTIAKCKYPYGTFVFDTPIDAQVIHEPAEAPPPSTSITASRLPRYIRRPQTTAGSEAGKTSRAPSAAKTTIARQTRSQPGPGAPRSFTSPKLAKSYRNPLVSIFAELWTVQSDEDRQSGQPWTLSIPRDRRDRGTESTKTIAKPTLLSRSILSYTNANIIPKLWVIIYIPANVVIEGILQSILFEAEMPTVGTLVTSAMVSPSRDASVRKMYWKLYEEVRSHSDLLTFFLLKPGTDDWNGKSEHGISNVPFSFLLANEIQELAVDFSNRLRIELGEGSVNLLIKHETQCGKPNCSLNHRIFVPNGTKAASMTQNDARVLFIHLFDAQINRYKASPPADLVPLVESKDSRIAAQEKIDYDFNVIILASKSEPLELSPAYLTSRTVKRALNLLVHLAGKERLAVTLARTHGSRGILPLNSLAFCGAIMLEEVFRLCFYDDTDAENFKHFHDKLNKDGLQFHTACQMAARATGSDAKALEIALDDVNYEQGFHRVIARRDASLKKLPELMTASNNTVHNEDLEVVEKHEDEVNIFQKMEIRGVRNRIEVSQEISAEMHAQLYVATLISGGGNELGHLAL